ncbi:MAG TPA: hypothetical protein VGQ22_18055 [Steroidobacteraceae bacterium]|jgi:hypothetical protein|nr:hypothetical protein [Steroidobacteraceae bacterium]
MNANVKKTLITTVLAFTAGAACAGTITMFSYKDTLSPEEFLERSTALLAEVADLGAHVAGTRDGQTFLRSAPPIACIPPPNPKMPEGTVPIAQLNAGIAALLAVNEGRLDGEQQLAQWVEKCHIVGD